METKFTGHNIFLKQMRSDKGFRVEIDADQSQYPELAKIPMLAKGLYEIIIKPIVK